MKKGMSASITVEASILYPMIIMLYYSIICMAFHLHDVSKIEGIMNNMFFMMQGEQYMSEKSLMVQSSDHIENELEHMIKDNGKKELLNFIIEDVRVSYSNKSMTIHIVAESKLHQLFNSKYNKSKSVDFVHTASSIRSMGEWIRMIEYIQ